MSRFDFDKLLAEANVKLAQEQQARLHDVMDKIIETVEQEARDAVKGIVTSGADKISVVRSEATQELDVIRAELTSLRADIQTGQQAIASDRKLALEAIENEANSASSNLRTLKASRVTAELVWNDLPKKIIIGGTALAGLILGAALTVLVAAAERRSVNDQIDIAQRQVQNIRDQIQHWHDTTGFKLVVHHGKPAVRIDAGQEFKKYVPSRDAINAGNLWVVR